MKRRDFLRNAVCSSLACASSTALFTQLSMMNSVLAAQSASDAPGDYRALVCLFMLGGNDSFNLLIPNDNLRYPIYSTSRSGPGPTGMAIDRSTLLPINVGNAGSGETYGLHPSCAEMAQLFNAGHAAFVPNVGTLFQPTRKNDYLNVPGYPVPPQLFSHADQQGQWAYGQAASNGATGWGGLTADKLYMMNPGATIPMSISLGGENRFQTGVNVQPYAMGSGGPITLNGYKGVSGAAQAAALQELLQQSYPDPLSRTYAATVSNALDYYSTMQTALNDAPTLTTVFPLDNPVAASLQMIAKIISVRSTLKAQRQIFFVPFGGFDTHDSQLADQPGLFARVSAALGAFYAATDELQVQNSVTTFTISEFARTLNSNGDGTDHAWGGIQFVSGGAVAGGKLYGAPAVSGRIFPDLTLNGPDCLSRGQMIPTVASDQYSATLARWLGLSDSDAQTVFPNLHNWGANPYLGFLG